MSLHDLDWEMFNGINGNAMRFKSAEGSRILRLGGIDLWQKARKNLSVDVEGPRTKFHFLIKLQKEVYIPYLLN